MSKLILSHSVPDGDRVSTDVVTKDITGETWMDYVDALYPALLGLGFNLKKEDIADYILSGDSSSSYTIQLELPYERKECDCQQS